MEKNIQQDISEAINIGLRRKRIQQAEIAEELGITRAAVSKWCCGDAMPSADNLVLLIRKLDLVELLFPEQAQNLRNMGVDEGESMTEKERAEFEAMKEQLAIHSKMLAQIFPNGYNPHTVTGRPSATGRGKTPQKKNEVCNACGNPPVN